VLRTKNAWCATELLAQLLQGRSIEDVMKEFGNVSRQMADNPMLQWLGRFLVEQTRGVSGLPLG
jgi:hypothetical protein